MPLKIVDSLKKGAKANQNDKLRRGNLIKMPPEGQLIVTGDLHGHRRNFERIQKYADLKNNPQRHLLLQEVIHGGPENAQGNCISYKLLFDVVRYKLKFPHQIHIIMSNHDTAFISESEIIKNGKEMNRSIRSAIEKEFREKCEDITDAMKEFLLSQPLAVQTPNRIWLSHSLPSDRFADEFDTSIFHKTLTEEDLIKPASAYTLTWGRRHSQKTIDRMAELLDADIFILGHQNQPEGWCKAGTNLIIIASDHNYGCLLPIELKQSYTTEKLIKAFVRLSSIA